jgi:hypothetical protein
MQRIITTARLLAAAATIGLATLAEAATVTYDYVGNSFNSMMAAGPAWNPYGTPPLSESMSLGSSINASVTFDAAFVTSSFTGVVSLTQNASYFSSWDISTTGGTYGNSAGGTLKALSITFSNGLISEWNLEVTQATATGLPVKWKTQFKQATGPVISDQSDSVTGLMPSAFTITRDVSANPGTWTRGVVDGPVSEVPLPAALPLFGTAIAAMGLFGTRKRRKMSAGIA